MCGRRIILPVGLTSMVVAAALSGTNLHAAEDQPDQQKVSYYKDVRPIFQAQCQGCHQPAKPDGEYIMTSFDRLLKGGESEDPGVVPGKPDDSTLLLQIIPEDGKADMPKGKKPLAAAEIALIRRWIDEGAVDDTPPGARQLFDKDNPPVYTRPPVITSLDFSPDGGLLAIAGFHEVLLFKADGSERVARLVGMSERIESVSFSPDGRRLAVTGGQPGRMGEVQIWDVEKYKLLLSVPATYDTVYGGSWSPDGKLIAFGAADTAVRAIESETGKEVAYMAAHDDWTRDTVFSGDAKSIFSVSRDMTIKMTDVATQRFVGNVTTHTPGILRGGMIAIARHPKRNEVFAGGSDGAPKLFRMDVKAAPAGGGNPNQIREYPGLPGRLFAVAFNMDGTRAYAASSLDGKGQVKAYETDSGKELWKLEVPQSGIYSIAPSPDGNTLAVAGSDGLIRLLDATSGQVRSDFQCVELSEDAAAKARSFAGADGEPTETTADEALPKGFDLVSIEAEPKTIQINRPTDYVQIVLTANLTESLRADASRLVNWKVEGGVGQVSPSGRFTPAVAGSGKVIAELNGKRAEIPVSVAKLDGDYLPDFIRDVNPVISRAGCNGGTCHGSQKGKNGFTLSLRGYDALSDVRSFTDDLASRRTNVAAPDNSLMLLKSTSTVPHTGGQIIKPDSKYYRIIRDWIGAGAKLNLDVARVSSIAIFPQNPVVERIGSRQQVRVVATYTDGATRDVTREAFISSGNTEIATIDRTGLLTTVRRGEGPVLARYEGAYAATTLTVMGDRDEFVWQPPETWGRIDELTAAKWQRVKVLPSALCTDAEFIRRVYLDLTGLPPTAEMVKAFLADERATRVKRDALVDELIGSDDFIDHWTNKWADLLQVNRKFLGPQGAAAFRKWIRDEVAANTPYDQFAHKVLTASGSNRENPQASYFKILRDPLNTMENTTHLFLGVRFNCNKCHDHPFERWTQNQYYQTAAYFAQFELKTDPASGKNKIGGTAVEGAKPLYEIVADKNAGEVTHDRTKQVMPPQFPFECKYEAPENASRRQILAAWITSPDNQYFALSYVNRLWGYLFGPGIIEPIDDIRAGNPPTNPELLDYLTQQFVESKFNVRHVLASICKSRTYQLSIETNRWNEDDRLNYSHAVARRLPAEVLYDAVHRVTGSISKIPGVPPGTRAAALPDSGVKLPDGFLGNLGRPARESACECERTTGLQLGPVMALISGPTVAGAIGDPGSELAKLVAAEKDDTRLVNEIFLRVMNRPAMPAEIEAGLATIRDIPAEHEKLAGVLKDYEDNLASLNAEREKKRQEDIDKAKSELAAYQQEIAPRETELNKKQMESIAQAEAALKAHDQSLPARLAEWEKKVNQTSAWTALDPIELSATNQAKLAKEDDLSVFVSGPEGKGSYKFVARTDVTGITGIKLEAISDDRLPSKGPGRPPNGNFVVTEFRVEWAPETEPDKKTAVELQNAQADFSQQNYDVKTAIDKNNNAATNNGWAVSPQLGKSHTAVFETKADTGNAPGRLTIWLDQQFSDGKHALGRFRISITSAPRPIKLDGLPKDIADILAVAADQRNDKQKAELSNYYRGIDGGRKKLELALAEAKKPRPVDPKLKSLQDKVTAASAPLPVDPRLGQLRQDVETSKKQLENSRLTAAQDLTWALINNPAFLFNR